MMSKPKEFQKVYATAAEAAEAQRQLVLLRATKPWYRAEIGPRLKPSAREFYKNYIKLEGKELLDHLYAIVSSSVTIRNLADNAQARPGLATWRIPLCRTVAVVVVYSSYLQE